MVLAGKIFRLKEKVSLKDLAEKLKGFKVEETYRENGFQLTLTTEIKELNHKENLIEGKILRDEIIHLRQKDQIKPFPKTVEAPFTLHECKNTILMTILGKKWKANSLANLFSEKIFGFMGFVLEVRIPPENLKKYHEENPEGTKVIFFNDVNLPNVKKLSLYGADLKNSTLYKDFLSHGNMWYVVVTSKRYGYVVGLTGNGIVTVFNQISVKDFLAYVREEVFPLIMV
ncbi:MAG: hypothetical protein DRO36_00440 [Candidatus Hecatellales archaeon]|nr:MAG: hypothetical protein DRO36_00440 [Candidatus Hecatellales archaeon]